jgi:hypothetical protein
MLHLEPLDSWLLFPEGLSVQGSSHALHPGRGSHCSCSSEHILHESHMPEGRLLTAAHTCAQHAFPLNHFTPTGTDISIVHPQPPPSVFLRLLVSMGHVLFTDKGKGDV